MNLKIKKVNAEEIEVLQQIGIRTYKEHFSEIWTHKGINQYLNHQFGIEKLKSDITNNHVKYFLAYLNEEPIGYLKLNMDKPQPNSKYDTGIELEKIYLIKSFSGGGIGEKILDFVIQFANEYSIKNIWLCVLKLNEKAKSF